MGNIPVIIIVGVLIVWVVTQVVRAQQNETRNSNRNNRNPQPPGSNPSPTKTIDRNSATDIDRFLMEIDRLRQRAAQPKPDGESQAPPRPAPAAGTAPAAPRPRPVAAPRPAATAPRPRPVAPAAPPRPEPAKQSPAPAYIPPTPLQPVVTGMAAAEREATQARLAPPAAVMNQADLKFAQTAATLADGSLLRGDLLGSTPELKRVEAVTPIVALVRSLLKNPQGRGAAVALKMILDPPPSAKR